MKRVPFAVVVTCGFLLSSLIYPQPACAQEALSHPKAVETVSLDQIHAGMRGVAYTVFQGTKPESMDVEVLGVLRNVNGPKGDIILVRLGGAKVEYAGVVAGMSGSPGYFKGKLAGGGACLIGGFYKKR